LGEDVALEVVAEEEEEVEVVLLHRPVAVAEAPWR
jgi:hypothetical protein